MDGRVRVAEVLRYLTHLGGATATLVPGIVLLLVGGDARAVGMAVVMANVSSNAAVQLLKRMVARPRPCDANGHPLALVPLPDPFSFPSGHASAATAVALTLTLAYGWAGAVSLPIAALVAASRVTLRVHHLGDVVAGAALGAGGALLAATLLP
jgi:undecaprenyl-diphosphatase